MTDDVTQLGALAGALLAISGLILVIGKGLRGMVRTWRRVRDFLDDWNGEAARDGVPRRAGVMERIATIEAQLKPNGGTSLHDKVTRIEQATGADQP